MFIQLTHFDILITHSLPLWQENNWLSANSPHRTVSQSLSASLLVF